VEIDLCTTPIGIWFGPLEDKAKEAKDSLETSSFEDNPFAGILPLAVSLDIITS